MAAILKIILVFVLLIFLIRKKCPLGYAMLAASIVLGFAFRMTVLNIVQTSAQASIEKDTLEFAGILILILILSKLLQETGQLRRTVEKLKLVIKDSRIILAGAPALIGFLPMIGGAIFSAPMVEMAEESAHKLDPVKRAFINYWFRHIWEYAFPLYPGILLAAKMAEVELQRMCLVQIPLTITALILGLIFGLLTIPVSPEDNAARKCEARDPARKGMWFNLYGLGIDILPVVLVIVLTLGFKIPVLFSLGASILTAVFINRITPARAFKILRKENYVDSIMLVVGIMVFKKMLGDSGAVMLAAGAFIKYKVPLIVLVMGLPFLIGIITGITVAFVGICYPILLSFIPSGNLWEPIKLNYLMLAFASGFAGVLLSPVHVCLILTKDYFKADFGRIYRGLLAPVVILIFAALLIFYINR